MNLPFRVLDKIREMRGAPAGTGVNAVVALEWLDDIARKVVEMHQQRVAGAKLVAALLAEREGYRTLLTAIAFEQGLQGRPDEMVVLIDWPPDPVPAPAEEKPKVAVPAPKRLVSLH